MRRNNQKEKITSFFCSKERRHSFFTPNLISEPAEQYLSNTDGLRDCMGIMAFVSTFYQNVTLAVTPLF
jgi:hypothetical protein